MLIVIVIGCIISLVNKFVFVKYVRSLLDVVFSCCFVVMVKMIEVFSKMVGKIVIKLIIVIEIRRVNVFFVIYVFF